MSPQCVTYGTVPAEFHLTRHDEMSVGPSGVWISLVLLSEACSVEYRALRCVGWSTILGR